MAMKRSRFLGSCLLIALPFPLGLGLWFTGMSAGFDGAGLWARNLTYVGLGLAIAGPLVVALGLALAGRFDPPSNRGDEESRTKPPN